MPKIPGIPHLRAVRALEKAGFKIVREGKHIVMSNGVRFVTIPRNNPVHAITMGGIVRDAGLSVEEFKKLLQGGTKLAHNHRNCEYGAAVTRLYDGPSRCFEPPTPVTESNVQPNIRRVDWVRAARVMWRMRPATLEADRSLTSRLRWEAGRSDGRDFVAIRSPGAGSSECFARRTPG